MYDKSIWKILYVILAVLILLSIFALPKVAIEILNSTKGQIITVSS